jgi:hypothetical protein
MTAITRVPLGHLHSACLSPWDLGAARARAGRDLPEEGALREEWGFSLLESGLFGLGYLEAKCGGFPPGTRQTIERTFQSAHENART